MEIISGTAKEFLVHLGFEEQADKLVFDGDQGRIVIRSADFYRPKHGVLNAIIESVLQCQMAGPSGLPELE